MAEILINQSINQSHFEQYLIKILDYDDIMHFTWSDNIYHTFMNEILKYI